MNVGINGRHLGPNKTGVGRYLFSLLQQWQHDSHGHRFFVYTSTEQLEPEDQTLFVAGSPIIHHHIPRPFQTNSFHLWYNWSLPQAMAKDDIDWFFSPDYFCPPFLRRRIGRSMSIHDASFLSHPEWFPWLYRLSCQVYSRYPASQANIIFTLSEFARREILQQYRVDPGKVIVTPLAADPKFSPDQMQPLLIPDLGTAYFLYVGKILNRRHVRELLLAFRSYLIDNSDTKIQLVIRGQDETHPPQHIEQLIASINAELGRPAVVCPAFCNDQQLVQLYRNARAFFYLSTYEGFGLPVLEALACGTPTVTVRASSIPEVAGEAAVFVDPMNAEQLQTTIRRLASDEPWVSELRRRSRLQVKRFSWATTSDRILEAIERSYGA